MTIYLLIAAVLVFAFFQFRNSRKRAKETATRKEALVAGVEVMTNYGLFGTIMSIDEPNNFAYLEIAPGTIVKIHRSTILKAADPLVETEELPEESATVDDSAVELNEDHAIPATDPQFGERVESDPTKPVRKGSKKIDD